MFRIAVVSALLLSVSACCCQPPDIGQISREYVQKWKWFYPTEALAAGDGESAIRFEDFSAANVGIWLQYNKDILQNLSENKHRSKLSLDDRIDMELLVRKMEMEIARWETDKSHLNSPSLYAGLISQAFSHLAARPLKDRPRMREAVLARLNGVSTICDTAIGQLKDGPPERSAGAADGLKAAADFYRSGLPGIMNPFFKGEREKKALEEAAAGTAEKILELSAFISGKIIPASSFTDAYGKERYNSVLRRYTGLRIHSLKLQRIALDEIERVRKKIGQLSAEFWKNSNPGKMHIPGDEECIGFAFGIMESHRVNNSSEFLEQFKNLIDRAEKFMYEAAITATRDRRTLITALSPPHFAGAAIGGVYPAGPFNPEADTLFYLPTVPDDSPLKVRDGFYRSFNKHFNSMIITHEIFPGHYLQLKAGATNPHIVRSLFGDDLFSEGWASLCEQITLDRGWDGDNILTRLAHLRKRLENAVRAYSSVQVHCNGWGKNELTAFAVGKGLLPPQFAENLWHRVINSPFQLTSYFLGFTHFDTLLKSMEKTPGFSIRKFCDRILSSGSVPMELLDDVMKNI